VLRILVVDDESSVRFLLRQVIEGAGYEVVEAHNGAVALARMVGFRPDLVVTDLMMPVMGGPELIARLRSDPETRSIPIVVVSAQRDAGSHVVDAVFSKPLLVGEFLETIRSLAAGGD
jgi:CheY-like chemotaxis protein